MLGLLPTGLHPWTPKIHVDPSRVYFIHSGMLGNQEDGNEMMGRLGRQPLWSTKLSVSFLSCP